MQIGTVFGKVKCFNKMTVLLPVFTGLERRELQSIYIQVDATHPIGGDPDDPHKSPHFNQNRWWHSEQSNPQCCEQR